MFEIIKLAKALWQNRRGVTALEYGLIAGAIALAIVAGVTSVGSNIAGVFNNIATNIK